MFLFMPIEEAIQITGMKALKMNCFFLGNTTRLWYKFRGAVALTIGRGSH
ncbi:hypothetical protein R3W88_000795 [Solanum pinnatisectum]|uniref:Uncharacterized protein n=1 Tax=Solanum pinnatisectum TaxID=50273 RepID=A0AAV9MI35_9SOLN|nr:hypothetical protein R3W88_000795 [Solanum pinnatisectum]